ncbi:MAG: SDR family NAD(P)-dependent oxidoreductase [Pseudomonadota bacterium]
MGIYEKYGPWALIAGASEGTGAAFAHRLASEGLKIILIARREQPLAALAVELQAAYGTETLTASIDLAAPGAIEKIAAVAESREVGLYISNAGGDPNGTAFFETDIKAWTDLVARNVVAVMQASHLLGAKMRERKRGGIILVGSGACYGGASGLGVYSGSKAFDLCFGEGLWAELRRHDVDVLNLILGRTDTPEFRRWLESRGAPMPSDVATAADVARVGLERLPYGPVHNWGLEDDDAGRVPQSAAARRNRILAMEAVMQNLRPAQG